MRILHVAQALARSYGGVQTVLHELARAQAAAGLEVDVLSTNVELEGVLPVAPNEFIPTEGARFRYSSVQFRPLLVSLDVKGFLDSHISQYDLVHIHGLYRFPVTYAALRARKQRVAYVISPHGALDPFLYSKSSRSIWLKRIYERYLDLPNLLGADAIHFTTRQEKELASFLVGDVASIIVPLGVDWRKYEQLPRRGRFRQQLGLEDEPVVLFLGRLHFKKGLDILIPAFEIVRRRIPAATLVIAGPESDGYGERVRQWVHDRDLTDSVRFTGPVHGTDILEAYVDADVFALPSYTENFGLTVVEALACMLPVVVSDQVNIHGDIASAKAGTVVSCDPVELARALISLLSDPKQRRNMGEAGRALVRDRFTWGPIVDMLTRDYQTIIDNHQESA